MGFGEILRTAAESLRPQPSTNVAAFMEKVRQNNSAIGYDVSIDYFGAGTLFDQHGEILRITQPLQGKLVRVQNILYSADGVGLCEEYITRGDGKYEEPADRTRYILPIDYFQG